MQGEVIGAAVLRFAQMGYAIVGLGTLAEGLSLPFPSLIFIIMAGAAVAAGRMSFWNVVFLASTAYTLGAIMPYYLGYNLARLTKYRFVRDILDRLPQPAIAVNSLFARHGNKIVALSRPFWIGNCVSYFAGINKMPTLKFVLYTYLGIFPWAMAGTYAGTIFGANTAKALEFVTNYAYVVVGALTLLFVVRYMRKRVSLSRS